MIRIVTDTAADITAEQAAGMGVELVALDIHFPHADYDQAADPDYSQFYRLLETEEGFPSTSQPPPEAFAAIFEDAQAKGDTVLAILISSGLSGTIQSAQIAKDTVGYPDVHIVDSRCAIMPQRILVEYAAKLRGAGEGILDLVRKVEQLRGRVKVYGMLDTLTYLYKGGRLSRTVALAGNLLHIKPVITLKDSMIALAGRGRNYAALIKKMAETGFDPEFPVYFGYTADDSVCRKMMAQVVEQFTVPQTGIFPIGGLIGAHVGPHGMAIAYVTKEA